MKKFPCEPKGIFGVFRQKNDLLLDPRNTPDLYFSREVLRLLDPSLVKYNYRININVENIVSPHGDTITISIYDFSMEQKNEMIKNLFTDSFYIEKFI
jgi:hypothetical protein